VAWAPDYAEHELVKKYMDADDTIGDIDLFVSMWTTAVSRNVDDFCGRQFGRVDALEPRYYTPVWDREEGAWYATIDDVQDLTDLTVSGEDDVEITAAGYTLLPRNAAARGRPYERLRYTGAAPGELEVWAWWGWTAVPPSVPTGLLLQAARLNKRRDSPFGIAGSPSAQGAGEVRLLAQLDPDFRTALAPFRRNWWAA
jgi:hypothetical protein